MAVPRGDWLRCWGGRVLHYFLWKGEGGHLTLCGKRGLIPHTGSGWTYSSCGCHKCARCQRKMEKLKEADNGLL